MRMWVEILFNISYLVVIWWLVAVMWSKRANLVPEKRRQADLVMAAFALLAFGDMGHVGFRLLAYLVLCDAIRANDRTFLWIGVGILISYACYTPVVLFVQQAPMLGMQMIPKTMAYVAIGFLVYFDLFKGKGAEKRLASGRA
jgi:hypothetical protein